MTPDEFHHRHNPNIIPASGTSFYWSCTCGAKGQEMRDAYKVWKGYYAHVGRAARKELGR